MVARLPRELGRHHPVLERSILELRPLRASDDRLGELLIVEQIADALLLIGKKSIDLRDIIDMDAGSADQGEGRQARGIADREISGDPATKRASDEMDAAQIELIEKVQIEVGEITDAIEPCGRVRLAEAGMLGRDNVEFPGQPRHRGKPDADAAAAMKKDERGAGPSAHEPDAAIADGEGRDRMGGHSSRSLSLAAKLRRGSVPLEHR